MSRRIIFDIVRKMLGRGFRQREVAALDSALDDLVGSAYTDAIRAPPRTVGPDGIRLIREFEGCARITGDGRVAAYPDPGTGAAPWTIGWGATGPDIGPDTVWTQEQCDVRLEQDIARHAAEVDAALGDAPTSQHQFDALVSFHYNTGAIARSTLLIRHLAGDYAAARAEFSRWNRAAGRVLRGLVRRRKAEADLYAKR